MNASPIYADPDIGCAAYRHPRHIATVTVGPPSPPPPAPPPLPAAPQHRRRRQQHPEAARRGVPVNDHGSRIWRWRRDRHLTQREAAATFGVLPAQLSQWERGLARVPGGTLRRAGIPPAGYTIKDS